MPANVAQLFAAGFLHKIVGVRPGTSGKELKDACRLARLQAHPDKGGSKELFNIVEEAVQILLNVLPEVDVNAPLWLNRLRVEIDRCRYEFDRGCGNVKILQGLRTEYMREYRKHMDKLQEKEFKKKQAGEEAVET